eukprot:TRINITY_DN45555_c0_g1_i1.p1 TRINITY_DN45555_c0_g1~~TRINITY_DN45555_c0_g1_i1.p1  ORF type:complete len:286 (-),score=28.32 TRINITY_DN45555_c0_g1_i1:275-1036(-)
MQASTKFSTKAFSCTKSLGQKKVCSRFRRRFVTMSSSSRVIYWGSGSTPCWRALLALEEKGLPYESKLLEFSKKEHKSEEVLAINPRGQLPAFKDGDAIVNESMAIVDYLELTYPEPALIPSDKVARAKALQRYYECVVSTEKFRDAFLMKMRGQIQTPEDEKKFSENVEGFKAELAIWEGYLTDTYVAGPEFTIADINAAPFFISGERFGATYKEFPNIRKYVDMIKQRPSVVKTTPPHWKDSESKDWLSAL